MPYYIITDLGTVRYAGPSSILNTSYQANVASERLDYHNIMDRMRGRRLGYPMRELIEIETAVVEAEQNRDDWLRNYERAQSQTDALNLEEIQHLTSAQNGEPKE